MEYRRLSGLRVSAVGLGCMGMSHGYGLPADKREMTQLLADAVEMGYTMFDTDEIYGTVEDPHANEELLGAALQKYRDRIILATKFGLTFDDPEGVGTHPLIPDSSPEAIRRSVEGSLRRLRTDHIDLYYQHRIDPAVEPETVAGVMADLIKEGKILHWGISEANEEYLRRANAVCRVTAVQNRYSMMARWNESLFPTLEELGIGFVAFSPLANGLPQITTSHPNLIRTATIVLRCRSSAKKVSTETESCLTMCSDSRRSIMRHPRRFHWHGCCVKSPGLCLFPALVIFVGSKKMRERLM